MERNLDKSVRPLAEVAESVRKRVIENYGRLFTKEEAVKMVDEIRAELRQRDENAGDTK